MTNSQALITLNAVGFIGQYRLKKLGEMLGSPQDICRADAKALLSVGVLDQGQAQYLASFNKQRFIEHEFKACAQANINMITMVDGDYPKLLAEIPDAPLCLYTQGDVGLLSMPACAMVGGRQCSLYGKRIARKYAGELSAHGIVIVSGMALGIDGASHEGALEADGKTIAVLGTGIDQIYPPAHQLLRKRIVEHGLIVSEFPLKAPPKKEHFPGVTVLSAVYH